MQAFRCTAVATALLITVSAHAAQDNLVKNGSLNGTIGTNVLPSDWTRLQGSPDLMDALNNVGLKKTLRFGAAPNESTHVDGGTWIGLGADVGYTERFGQSISGLTIGQQYQVSWEAGNFGYDGGQIQYLGSNAINVLIDGSAIGSGATLSLGTDWTAQTLTFIAGKTSHELSFKLATSNKAYLSIDGITVRAVPEPATWMLMAMSMAGMGVVVRRRAARA